MAQSTAGPTAAPLPPAPPAGGRWANVPWAPILLAVAALPILVWLGRDMTFYHDEYAFLLLRDLSVQGIFAPHNEHLSATLVILYRVLLGTVGMVSYWPYLAVTFALHLVVAGIVFVVVRRETTRAAGRSARWRSCSSSARAATTSCGRSSPATIGATAAGMAAIVVAPRRPAVAAVLLTIALATSGVGLAFLVGTGLHLLLTRPRALAWLALPVGLYLAWLVVFGAQRMQALRQPSLEGVPEYVLSGLAASAAGVARIGRRRSSGRSSCWRWRSGWAGPAGSRRSCSPCWSRASRSSSSPGSSGPSSAPSRPPLRATSTWPHRRS